MARRRVSPRTRAKRSTPAWACLDGHVVGQGAPPALRGGVVGLLHHALAVPAPRRADRHRHPVVLGDRRRTRRCTRPEPGSQTVAIRSNRHTVCHPAQSRGSPGPGRRSDAADPPTATAPPATCPNATATPTSRCAVLPHPQHAGGSGSSSQSHWVSSPGRVLDHRVGPARRGAARPRTSGRSSRARILRVKRRIRQVEPQLDELVEQRAAPTGAGPRPAGR